MERLRGLEALVHDLIDATTHLVSEGHASVSRNVRRVADVTPLGAPVRAVDDVRAMTTEAILLSVRATNRLVERAAELGWRTAPPGEPPPPILLRSDRIGRADWAADALIGALNGVAGDHLRQTGNPLDLGMSLRVDGPVTGRLVVLVHGLSATEWSWALDAERRLGDAEATYGSLLARDAGFTPVYVRYNSGLPVQHNGERLARELARTVANWPHPVEDIVLIGHSMGGLVSATAIAQPEAAAWNGKVRHLITLATPHQGAPLARFAEVFASALSAIDLPGTRIAGAILARRSAGIQDLADPSMVPTPPPPPGVQESCFTASLLGDADHPLARWAGDGLVMPTSGAGQEGRVGQVVRHFPGRNHVEIQVDREVYQAILELVRPPG